VLSALGILLADVVRDHARTVMLSSDAIRDIERPFTELEEKARAEFAAEGLTGVPEYSLDLRYGGQGYELNVPWNRQSPSSSMEEFHRSHQQRYGFCDPEKPVQIVNLRLRMTASAEPHVPARHELVPGDGRAACYAERSIFFDDGFLPSRFYHREQLSPGDAMDGPAMITEYTSATILPPGTRASVDAFANLVIAVGERA
jgi:N-methylhydantoinase A